MKNISLLFMFIAVILAMSMPVIAKAENLLENPGFETGDTTGWSGGVDGSQAGYWVWDHDQRSGKWTAAAGSWTKEPTPIILSQEIPVKEGDKVVFSGWTSGQQDFAADSKACLKLEFLDGRGNVISSYESDSRRGVYKYVKDTVKGTAPAETDRASCIFYVVSTGGSATFDDAEAILTK